MHTGNDFQFLICQAEVSDHRPVAGRGGGLALVSNTCIFVVNVCDWQVDWADISDWQVRWREARDWEVWGRLVAGSQSLQRPRDYTGDVHTVLHWSHLGRCGWPCGNREGRSLASTDVNLNKKSVCRDLFSIIVMLSPVRVFFSIEWSSTYLVYWKWSWGYIEFLFTEICIFCLSTIISYF